MSYVPKQTTPRQRFRVRYLVKKSNKTHIQYLIDHSKVLHNSVMCDKNEQKEKLYDDDGQRVDVVA